jgi:hypothetical protein
MPALLSRYSPECVEEENSPKFGCSILYSSRLSGQVLLFHSGPAHCSQHYILRCWIKMRSAA